HRRHRLEVALVTPHRIQHVGPVCDWPQRRPRRTTPSKTQRQIRFVRSGAASGSDARRTHALHQTLTGKPFSYERKTRSPLPRSRRFFTTEVTEDTEPRTERIIAKRR